MWQKPVNPLKTNFNIFRISGEDFNSSIKFLQCFITPTIYFLVACQFTIYAVPAIPFMYLIEYIIPLYAYPISLSMLPCAITIFLWFHFHVLCACNFSLLGTSMCFVIIIQSPPKESIHLRQSQVLKIEGARGKVGGAPHPPLSWSKLWHTFYFSSSPPQFWVLGLTKVNTFFWGRLYIMGNKGFYCRTDIRKLEISNCPSLNPF